MPLELCANPNQTAMEGVWSSINRNLPGIFAKKILQTIRAIPDPGFKCTRVRLIFTDRSVMELTHEDLEAFSQSDVMS